MSQVTVGPMLMSYDELERLRIESGLTHEQMHEATLRACGKYLGTLGNPGTNEVVMPVAAIEQVRQAVSPWLWVFSLVGFGMAVVNSRRIAKMYGSWKRARTQLR